MTLEALMKSFKTETVLLGRVQRYLLAEQRKPSSRRQDVLHPSELVATDVCPRALYYRLQGYKAPAEEISFQLDVIFAAGHGYHDKWQDWAWGAGILRGRFRCLSCGHGDWELPGAERKHNWFAVSPRTCESCGAPQRFLTYGEVPVSLPEYRIAGHADGDLAVSGNEADDPLLEIKSIGDGTVRVAAPRLLRKHTKRVQVDGEDKNWTDWQALWRDIKRPFKAHVKQVTIYCLALGRTSAVLLYEYKPTGAVKEFRIDIDPASVAEELALAAKVLGAVEVGRPPKCPHKGCKKCVAYEEAQDEAETGSPGHPDNDGERGDGEARTQEPEAPEATPRRDARTAPRRRSRGVERSRRHRGDDDLHPVGGLPDRAGRTRRDLRGDRREVLPEDQGPQDDRGRRPQGSGPAGEGRSRIVRRGG